ncbi:hypothetical protein LCGC14_0422140 [marine sediment metagenome]|uniref:Glycosyltransferase subfamily 4-like N-terminal domain-containing protein n=1 Tax=marine sediment metagenome TaxID=412755 RepID=A0A0F9SWQ5_9ZZZZ
MDILVISYNIPGYAPNLLIKWLKPQIGYRTGAIRLPSRIDKNFAPILGHLLNFLSLVKRWGRYDLVVTPDPLTTLAVHYSKVKTKRLCYWRLDYHPKKFGHFNFVYQWIETKALKVADEVWSMADPTDTRVQRQLMYKVNLERHSKVKHVPYMLSKLPPVHPIEERLKRVLWMGPDKSRAREVFKSIAPDLAKLGFMITIVDYSVEDLRVNTQALDQILATSKVGVALYDPNNREGKYYSDPARIRHYLANGIPVVVTRVPPVWKDIVAYGAGVAIELDKVELLGAIKHCLNNFETMSKQALLLAKMNVMTEERFGLV